MNEKEMKELKSEIQDLLNQVLVKMKNVPEVDVSYNDWDSSPIYGTFKDEDMEVKNESKELLYLSSVRDVLKNITDNGAEYMMEQYYNSNC